MLNVLFHFFLEKAEEAASHKNIIIKLSLVYSIFAYTRLCDKIYHPFFSYSLLENVLFFFPFLSANDPRGIGFGKIYRIGLILTNQGPTKG